MQSLLQQRPELAGACPRFASLRLALSLALSLLLLAAADSAWYDLPMIT